MQVCHFGSLDKKLAQLEPYNCNCFLKISNTAILTCTETGRPAFGADYGSARGKGQLFLLSRGEPQWPQCVYLNLCHLMRWRRTEQPGATPCCLGMGARIWHNCLVLGLPPAPCPPARPQACPAPVKLDWPGFTFPYHHGGWIWPLCTGTAYSHGGANVPYGTCVTFRGWCKGLAPAQ